MHSKGGNRGHNAIEGNDSQHPTGAVPPTTQMVNNHIQSHHSHALNLTRNNGTIAVNNGGSTPGSATAVASSGQIGNFAQSGRRIRNSATNAAINANVDNGLVAGIDGLRSSFWCLKFVSDQAFSYHHLCLTSTTKPLNSIRIPV